jgi:hypothetical protein
MRLPRRNNNNYLVICGILCYINHKSNNKARRLAEPSKGGDAMVFHEILMAVLFAIMQDLQAVGNLLSYFAMVSKKNDRPLAE